MKWSEVFGTDEVLAATTGDMTLNRSRIVAIAAGNAKPASSVQCLIIVCDRVDGEKPTINVQLSFRYCNLLFIHDPSHSVHSFFYKICEPGLASCKQLRN